MTTAVYIAICAGVAVFVAGCVLRFLEYSRTPLHLRWELYPVPHEEPGRVDHGGSYFESGEWWLSPQVIHHRREWTTMFQEIVFLKGVREFNRRLWLSSFLFHFGVYLAIATVALLVVESLPRVLIANAGRARLEQTLDPVCRWLAFAAGTLILAGAILLLLRRLTDKGLSNYTKPGDIFNLLFFISTIALLALGSLERSPTAASLGAIARGLFRFDRSLSIGNSFGAGLVLASALAAYIPFTHMSHFIAKYFTYHSVRWDDRRNERGSAIEAKVAGYLNYKPTWAAIHMGADGKKTWAEIATTNPAQGAKK
jgi:nitrate reductase gamma subunit